MMGQRFGGFRGATEEAAVWIGTPTDDAARTIENGNVVRSAADGRFVGHTGRTAVIIEPADGFAAAVFARGGVQSWLSVER